MMLAPSPLEWVTVKTTLPAVPYPLLASRPDIRTERLVLRRTLESDLEGWHALRLQPEVMKWTSQGRPDKDLEWSRERFVKRLAPAGDARYEFIICLAETGEMIGTGGCYVVTGQFGWPVIGYMLRREFWGKGYATEFVNGFLEAWWALPRADVDVKVERSTVERAAEDGLARECIVAVTLDSNRASQNVLAKCKLQLVKVWAAADLRDPTQTAVLARICLWDARSISQPHLNRTRWTPRGFHSPPSPPASSDRHGSQVATPSDPSTKPSSRETPDSQLSITGAITTISFISLPAIKAVPEASGQVWTEMYARGASSMPKIGAAVAVSYLYAAYDTHSRGGRWEGFAVAAACVASMVPFTLIVMKGTNDKLHKAAKDGVKGTDPHMASAMNTWGVLNFTRGLLPFAGAILGARALLADAL
ncbi:Uncharacterized protein TPAR_04006 [Tolypocladium paradoxum]|uniref:N-acetyltransferase domain-containing protein n=1 Tax=Tolypocladium paradoxum TaxID=94208 RepID=A0A2S4L032_9HYPO|nr:Uncharacterized protein TPAR_04006 [Tolypocladium paradoxum]